MGYGVTRGGVISQYFNVLKRKCALLDGCGYNG